MIFNIKVKPNSSFQRVDQISEKEYKIYLKSKPENNKANIELVNLLSKHFKMNVINIKILKGKSSRNKIVEINLD